MKLTKGFNYTQGRVKLVLPAPWTWDQNSFSIKAFEDDRYQMLNDSADIDKSLYSAPSLAEATIDSPFEASAIFNEQLVANRAFKLQIKGIKNPFELSTGTLRVYTMEPNSNDYIEKNEKDCSLQVTTYPIAIGIGLTAFPFDVAKGLTFYKDSV